MKINKKTKFILFSLLFLVFLIGAGFVLAKDLEVDYPLFEKAPELTEKSTLTDYIGYVFNFVIFASGFIILGVLIYSGILYLISAGDPGRQSEAKNRIINGFVGIIIILSSYLILTTISPSLVMVHLTTEGIKITEPGEPPEIEEPEPETFTLFQVPAGKIVERIVLDDEAAEFLGTNEEIQELMSAEQALNRSLSDENFKADLEGQEEKYSDSVLGQVNKTKEFSELLLILSNELKIVTDACDCGWSKCPITPPCKGNNCIISCDYKRIESLKKRVTDTAQLLLEQTEPIRENQMVLVEKIMEIKKPAFLMSLMSQRPEGIIDYKTMLTQRHFLEEQGKKVEFETSDDWKDPGQDTESTADDSLLMDIRTGFEQRQELPPTFDPATFYFEKNNKTNVFIAKAGLIEPSLMVPDLKELFKKASEQVLKQWLEELLKEQLNIKYLKELAQEIIKEDLPNQQAVEELIKKLPEGLNEELLDGIKKESLDKLDTMFIDTAGSFEEQIKRIYEGISKNRLNINLPKDTAEGFTGFLSAVFSGSRSDCSLENSIRDSLKMSFRDNGINSLDDLVKRLTKYSESGSYDLLKIELENKQILTLNDLINKTTEKLTNILGDNINLEQLNVSASENLSSVLSQNFGINLSLGGMTNLPKTFGNKLLSSLMGPYIDSLNDMVKEALNNSFSLEGLTNNGLIKDLFQDTGIYTIEDLAERIGLTPVVLKDILDDFNILEFDDLVTGVSKELSIDLTDILKGGSLEKAGIETLEKLNERLSGEINSILIYDFQIGNLPTDLKTNINNNLLSLLHSSNVGSLESLIDKSLGGFLDKSTRDGLNQVLESLGGVNDFDGLNSVLITNFNERLKTNFGIENLGGFIGIIAGGKGELNGLSDYLLVGLENESLETLGIGGVNDILIGETSPGINEILKGLEITLPNSSVLIPDFGFGLPINIETISKVSWSNIGVGSIDEFFKGIDWGNILNEELGVVFPIGINFDDFISGFINSPLSAITDILQEQLSDQISEAINLKFTDFSFIPSSLLRDNPFLQDLVNMTSDLLGLGSFFGF